MALLLFLKINVSKVSKLYYYIYIIRIAVLHFLWTTLFICALSYNNRSMYGFLLAPETGHSYEAIFDDDKNVSVYIALEIFQNNI